MFPLLYPRLDFGLLFIIRRSNYALAVSSGCFLHDVDLKMSDWRPRKEEMMVFSAAMHKMAERTLPIERLVVDAQLAGKMFEDNRHKSAQIPSIAKGSESGDSVTLYRVGDHVDISKGPMVGDTSFLGRRCTIAAVRQEINVRFCMPAII